MLSRSQIFGGIQYLLIFVIAIWKLADLGSLTPAQCNPSKVNGEYGGLARTPGTD